MISDVLNFKSCLGVDANHMSTSTAPDMDETICGIGNEILFLFLVEGKRMGNWYICSS